METWIFLAAGAVFLISIFVYVCLMVFLPEWVGITGQVALKNEASHREDSPESEAINAAEKTAQHVPGRKKPDLSGS